MNMVLDVNPFENPLEPRFVVWRCDNCRNGIEFDAVQLAGRKSCRTTCPHCGQETSLLEPPPPPRLIPDEGWTMPLETETVATPEPDKFVGKPPPAVVPPAPVMLAEPANQLPEVRIPPMALERKEIAPPLPPPIVPPALPRPLKIRKPVREISAAEPPHLVTEPIPKIFAETTLPLVVEPVQPPPAEVPPLPAASAELTEAVVPPVVTETKEITPIPASLPSLEDEPVKLPAEPAGPLAALKVVPFTPLSDLPVTPASGEAIKEQPVAMPPPVPEPVPAALVVLPEKAESGPKVPDVEPISVLPMATGQPVEPLAEAKPIERTVAPKPVPLVPKPIMVTLPPDPPLPGNMRGPVDVRWLTDLGVVYFKQHQFGEAFMCFSRAAQQGFPTAQFCLAVCYFNGHGVPQDEVAALPWLREAAAQGDANAEFTLGLAYRLGRGIAANEPLAMQWLQKAAAHGHAEAIQRVGGVNKETNVSNIISPVRVPSPSAPVAPVPEKNSSKPAHDLQRIILGLFRKK